MLKLYHVTISPNSRRVWITLLEKNLEFELVEVDLRNGAQFQPDFLALNPFHHIPVLTDGDFTVIESLAILDYLEAKYPTPALLPTEPSALAKVRMVEMVMINELIPSMNPLIRHYFFEVLPEPDAQKLEQSKQHCHQVLSFFEQQLGSASFFGGDALSLADIVAGVSVPFLPRMDIDLGNYPAIQAWCQRLSGRGSWQATQPSPEALAAFRSGMQARIRQQSANA